MADGGGDDDGVDDVRCSGGGTGRACGAASAFVVGNDVAAFQDARDLVLGSAAPGLGQDDDGDEGAEARPAACSVAARAFSVAASASQAETGLPSSAAAALMVFSTSAGTEIDSFRAVMRSC